MPDFTFAEAFTFAADSTFAADFTLAAEEVPEVPQGAQQEDQGHDDGRRPYIQFTISMFFFVIIHHEPFVDLLEVLEESESENRDGHGIVRLS